jgi:hypothetical protein
MISPQLLEQPALAIQIDGKNTLPENVLSLSLLQRAWNGVRIDVKEFYCAGRVLHVEDAVLHQPHASVTGHTAIFRSRDRAARQLAT